MLLESTQKTFLASIYKAFLYQELSSSQKHAVTKILKKRQKQGFIKNWMQILLLNTDMKIISKFLSTRLKNVSPFLVFSNQIAYVKSRFISKNGGVISDILEMINTLALEEFLVTIDIEKAFHSVNHTF